MRIVEVGVRPRMVWIAELHYKNEVIARAVSALLNFGSWVFRTFTTAVSCREQPER